MLLLFDTIESETTDHFEEEITMEQQAALTIRYDDSEEQLTIGDTVRLERQEGRTFEPFTGEVVRITPKRACLSTSGYITTRGKVNGTGFQIIKYKGKK